jgi:hypothetical protein
MRARNIALGRCSLHVEMRRLTQTQNSEGKGRGMALIEAELA